MHDMIESKLHVVNGHGFDSFEVFPIKPRFVAFNVLLLCPPHAINEKKHSKYGMLKVWCVIHDLGFAVTRKYSIP